MKTPVPSGRPMAREDTGAYFGILGPFQPGFSWVVPAAQGTLVYFMSLPEKPSGPHLVVAEDDVCALTAVTPNAAAPSNTLARIAKDLFMI